MPESLRILLSPSTLHAHRAEIDAVLHATYGIHLPA